MPEPDVDVSFCTTHLNSWPATKLFLESFWDQMPPTCELVIVDAGSTDPSRAFLEEFAKTHPGRFLFYDLPGSTRGAGFDLAWRRSRGRSICVTAADRTWRPGMARAVLDLARGRPDRAIKIFSPLKDTKLGAILIPRKALEALDGFDTSLTYFEDVDLLRRLERRFGFESETLDLYDLDWKGKMKRPRYLARYYWQMYRDAARIADPLGATMRPGLRRFRSWPFVAIGVVAYVAGLLRPKARSARRDSKPPRLL